MFETFGFENTTPQQASVLLAIIIGVLFGVFGQITKFCFRRSLIGEDRVSAAGVWLTALAFAVVGTQAAVSMGWISFAEHRFMIADLPIAAIVIGGLIFGAGMVLTRGCVSRLTILAG
ncbi:MAG: YeeE/YedE family protein, partial [Sulfitobacter sp.]|nr:YeeE/YedE family protein [Sulfitobacter sp.]